MPVIQIHGIPGQFSRGSGMLNRYEQAALLRGGITVSDGEPLMRIGFVTRSSLKGKAIIHTCLNLHHL